MRKLIAGTMIGAAMVAGAGFTGYALHDTNGPRSCTFDGGGRITSGDAARTDTGEWVCTDGTLVHVAGYGN